MVAGTVCAERETIPQEWTDQVKHSQRQTLPATRDVERSRRGLKRTDRTNAGSCESPKFGVPQSVRPHALSRRTEGAGTAQPLQNIAGKWPGDFELSPTCGTRRIKGISGFAQCFGTMRQTVRIKLHVGQLDRHCAHCDEVETWRNLTNGQGNFQVFAVARQTPQHCEHNIVVSL